jgi:hypothetical protein
MGLDLLAELERTRHLNSKLVSGSVAIIAGSLLVATVGLYAYLHRPEPDRVGVMPDGRVIALQSLDKGDPPDSRVTRRVEDCMIDLLNQPFTNYQNTVEKALSNCFTGGGADSAREAIDPLLQGIKKNKMELASGFVIKPFVNSRKVETDSGGPYRVWNIQAVLSVGYRGTTSSTKPVEYAMEVNIRRVPYNSHIEGTRLQNMVLKVYNGSSN